MKCLQQALCGSIKANITRYHYFWRETRQFYCVLCLDIAVCEHTKKRTHGQRREPGHVSIWPAPQRWHTAEDGGLKADYYLSSRLLPHLSLLHHRLLADNRKTAVLMGPIYTQLHRHSWLEVRTLILSREWHDNIVRSSSFLWEHRRCNKTQLLLIKCSGGKKNKKTSGAHIPGAAIQCWSTPATAKGQLENGALITLVLCGLFLRSVSP